MEKTKNLRVTVSMPAEQVERMDNCASKMGLSRNAFMQVAIADYITNKEMVNEELLTKIISEMLMTKGGLLSE